MKRKETQGHQVGDAYRFTRSNEHRPSCNNMIGFACRVARARRTTGHPLQLFSHVLPVFGDFAFPWHLPGGRFGYDNGLEPTTEERLRKGFRATDSRFGRLPTSLMELIDFCSQRVFSRRECENEPSREPVGGEPGPRFHAGGKNIGSCRNRHNIDDTVIELGELTEFIGCLWHRFPFQLDRDPHGRNSRRDSTRCRFLEQRRQLDHKNRLSLFQHGQRRLPFCRSHSGAVTDADLDGC